MSRRRRTGKIHETTQADFSDTDSDSEGKLDRRDEAHRYAPQGRALARSPQPQRDAAPARSPSVVSVADTSMENADDILVAADVHAEGDGHVHFDDDLHGNGHGENSENEEDDVGNTSGLFDNNSD